MKTQRISEDVQSVHLYKHRPVLFHLYALPFAIVYLLWGYVYFWAKPQALETWLQTNETETQKWVGAESNLSTGSEGHVTSNISDSTDGIPVNETVNVADDLPDISNLTIDELWLIGAALLGILHLLLCLSCVWSVHIRCLVTCTKVKRLRQAQCVKVVPTPNNGHTELVDLQRRKVFDPDNAESSRNPEITYWIEFQKTFLVCDDESKGEFQPVMFPISWNFQSYANWKGYETVDKLTEARTRYGKNDMEMVLPKFKTLMAERATAPFFVFQVFCVGLWCLDEAVYYSLFTLLMLVVFEATLVQQQMRNMSTIRDMGNKPTNVYVYRNKKWEIVMSNELVAGDVISVSTSTAPSSQSVSNSTGAAKTGLVAGRAGKHPLPSTAPSPTSSSSSSVPTGSVTCDLLLLRGQCIVDEAMLTGESVPQMKEPISEQVHLAKQNGNSSHESEGSRTSSDESCFNLASHGKLHVIYGGTKVIQTSWRQSSTGGPDSANTSLLSAIKSPPDHGCICFVLRTGFNTSQGKLLRTILFGVKRVTANNLETFFFILFLLIFAVSAASYVWIEGCKNPARSRYKLLLECTLIITSVVPPELPIELSLAVNSSMIALAKLAIFCTEPFRIPFAGKIDFCCFDKTGTLTSDTFVVEGVAGLNNAKNAKPDDGGEPERAEACDVTPVSNLLPKATLEALATCHSLGHMSTSSSSSDASAANARSNNQNKDSSASLIGDPLEKATFTAIQYSLSKNDVVSPPSGYGKDFRPWQIVSRFHFTSKLKRMTTLSAQTSSFTGETVVLAAIKGAPETLKPMFEEVPADYDSTFRKMTLSGARVLAIGYRYIPNTSISSAKQLTRSDLECNLKFGGFLVVSCPLKSDSKSVMADILKSSHHVAMITGDNALTACHVAKELEIIKKDRSNTDVMILEPRENKDDAMNGSAPGSSEEATRSLDQKLLSNKWVWRSIDGSKELSLSGDSNKSSKKWWHSYSFCLTGPGLQYLQDLKNGSDVLKLWVPRVCVFARVSPQQKEDVVTILKQLGFHTLMCGDGTNDVGALKHAHCGVALLSQPQKAPKKSSSNSSSSSSQNNNLAKNSRGAISSTKQNPFANISSNPRVQARADELMKKSVGAHPPAPKDKLAKDLEEAEGPTVVKLGDASIASPFTSKASSIESVCHIMKQGRCTLVTTLQMFKILALNALIFAYGQSVLYLDGVKFSDTQATLQGLLLAGCFLFVSRSQPLKVLSKERPLPNIFNIYTILTVCGQFTIHFSSLIFVVRQAKQNIPPKPEGEFVDLEKEFEPNILNSVVYLIDMGMQVSTFAVNYRGEPFMQSLWSHKPLRNCLLITFIVVLALTAHLMPELNEWFQLVPFPHDLQRNLILVIIADAVGCWLVDRVLCFIFGRGSLKSVK